MPYYTVFKRAETERSTDAEAAMTTALAELEPLASVSDELIASVMEQMGPPKSRHITLDDVYRFAHVFKQLDKSVILATCAYAAIRQISFRQQQDPPPAEQVVKQALALAWYTDLELPESEPPSDDFYRFFFSYRKAVDHLANMLEAYVFWLNTMNNNDRTWWGGRKKEYEHAARMLNEGAERALQKYIEVDFNWLGSM